MHWWRFGLAGAGAAALALAAMAAAAQDPAPPSPAPAHIVLDPRLPPDVAAAIQVSAGEIEAVTPRWLQSGAGCASPVAAAESPAPAGGSARFDLDTALRAAPHHGAGSVLVVAKGRSECLSIACALAASLAAADPAFRIDVLALGAAAKPLRCLAGNTGGQFKAAAPDAAAAAAKAMLTARLAESATASASTGTPGAGASAADAGPRPSTGSPAQQAATASAAATSPPPGAAAAEASSASTAPPDGEQAEAPSNAPSGAAAIAAPPGDGPPIPRRRPGASDASADAAAGNDEAPDSGSTEAQPFAWAAPPPAAPESEPRPDEEGPGVRLRVLAGPAGPLIESDLRFEVLSPAGDGTYRRVVASAAINPYFSLPKGEYTVRVSHGEVVREFPFAVTGERTAHLAFSLDIGYLSLRVRPTSEAAPLESGISYRISKIGGAPNGAADMRVQAAQAMVALPAGRYRIVSQSGTIKTAAEVEIEPGETMKHDFQLRLGYLRLSVPSAAEDVTLQVEAFSTAGTGTAKVLATAKGSTAMFRLQEGNYIAVALHGGHRVMQVATITQGKLTELSLDVPLPPSTPRFQ